MIPFPSSATLAILILYWRVSVMAEYQMMPATPALNQLRTRMLTGIQTISPETHLTSFNETNVTMTYNATMDVDMEDEEDLTLETEEQEEELEEEEAEVAVEAAEEPEEDPAYCAAFDYDCYRYVYFVG